MISSRADAALVFLLFGLGFFTLEYVHSYTISAISVLFFAPFSKTKNLQGSVDLWFGAQVAASIKVCNVSNETDLGSKFLTVLRFFMVCNNVSLIFE